MQKLTAVVHNGEADEGGFWATCLEVPGANGQGETKEGCLRSLAEAVKLLWDTERQEAFRTDPAAETTEFVLSRSGEHSWATSTRTVAFPYERVAAIQFGVIPAQEERKRFRAIRT